MRAIRQIVAITATHRTASYPFGAAAGAGLNWFFGPVPGAGEPLPTDRLKSTAAADPSACQLVFQAQEPVEGTAGWPRAASGSAFPGEPHGPTIAFGMFAPGATGRGVGRRSPVALHGRISALVNDRTSLGGPDLLPVRLAQACTAVLPVAGAGLSMFTTGDFRVPIGASDDMAADAERLQFTLGEGALPGGDSHDTTVDDVAAQLVTRRVADDAPFQDS